MIENKPEIEARTVWHDEFSFWEAVHEVGFEGEVKGFGYYEIAAGKRNDSKKATFMEYGVILWQPVFCATWTKQENCVGSAANRESKIWRNVFELPIELTKHSAPAVFDIWAVVALFQRWDIPLAA